MNSGAGNFFAYRRLMTSKCDYYITSPVNALKKISSYEKENAITLSYYKVVRKRCG